MISQNLLIKILRCLAEFLLLSYFKLFRYASFYLHKLYRIDLQSNLAISNSVNSKSPLFRRKIECPWIYPSPLRFPGYFEAPLFRTFFHFPWDFEIAGFDCSLTKFDTFSSNFLISIVTKVM